VTGLMTEQASPDQATPKKQNRGNRRTGRSKGYNGQKQASGRRGPAQLAWDRDPIVLERLRVVVYPMWLRRQPPVAILPVANALMKRLGVPEITLETIREDLKRCESMAQLDQQAVRDHVVEHLAEYDYLIQLMHEALRNDTISAINRDRLYGYILQAVDRKSKLDGSLEQGGRFQGSAEVLELPPSPMEMLAKGLATQEQLQSWMLLTAHRSGVKLPLAFEAVIEGEVVEAVPTSSAPAPVHEAEEADDEGLDEIDPSEDS
jgi:hypothetical protein